MEHYTSHYTVKRFTVYYSGSHVYLVKPAAQYQSSLFESTLVSHEQEYLLVRLSQHVVSNNKLTGNRSNDHKNDSYVMLHLQQCRFAGGGAERSVVDCEREVTYEEREKAEHNNTTDGR